jgi:hypothetical protein
MDIILLGITIVSLLIALVMSVAAWRVTRDEKQRSAARVAALSLAADQEPAALESFPSNNAFASAKPPIKAPWSPAPIVASSELPLNQPRIEPARLAEPSRLRQGHDEQAVSHASGFLGATELERDNGGRQKTLALAALVLFVVVSGGLAWTMSEPRDVSAAISPSSPLELVSLSHQRQDDKLAVSGLVRNPAAGQPIQKLSAVVFLFDRTGTFVTSSKANVDFLKLGAGDESPFVVSVDAPATVSRYRVSFRTDDGVVPHVDRRNETVGSQESTVKSQVISRQ